MNDPTSDELARLLEPARAARNDVESHARAVRRARARTLSGAPLRPRGSGALLSKMRLALAVAALALTALLFWRTGLRARFDRLTDSEQVAKTESSGSSRPKPIAFSVDALPGRLGERIEPIVDGAQRSIAFDDGTLLTLDPRAALRVLTLDDRGGHLLLERGTVHAAFQHREQTYWTIEAGGVLVEVTGMRFDVAFEPATQSFELAMKEGSVRIHGCGIEEGRVVRGVEIIQTSCAARPRAMIPEDLPSMPASSRAMSPPAPDLSLQLLLQANAARHAGETKAATITLIELRKRFPRGAAAPQAAFDLGVLAFDAEGLFADAARWFHRYLEEAPSGPLAREALGRLLEAQSRSGDSETVTSAARYLEMYPGGPHASLAKRLVASRP